MPDSDGCSLRSTCGELDRDFKKLRYEVDSFEYSRIHAFPLMHSNRGITGFNFASPTRKQANFGLFDVGGVEMSVTTSDVCYTVARSNA